MAPVSCLITDRVRFGGEDALVARVGAAARAGVHLVQVRERDLDGGPLLRLVTRCLAAAGGTSTRVLVNDRVDVALAAGAHGVHLRGDSMPASRVRGGVPAGFLIGRSAHAVTEVAELDATGGLDYVLFGTVFPSASKPGMPAAGTDRLAAAVALTRLPVLAVGGVSADTIQDVMRAGAAGFAGIGIWAGGWLPSHLSAQLPTYPS